MSTRRHQEILGRYGIATILGGWFISLLVLTFLGYLWIDQRLTGGDERVWRKIILSERITQVATLSSVILRVIITMQATIYTSLIASVVLEKYGAPLSQVASLSIMRASNAGPLSLAWALITSTRKSLSLATLAVMLLFISTAIQFSSTLLVSDLAIATIMDTSTIQAIPISMSLDSAIASRQINGWFGRPSAYLPFGEVSPVSDSTPSERGISDTGRIQRVFVPLSVLGQSTMRQYEGSAFNLDSRFVCIRPSVDAMLSVTAPSSATSTTPLFLQASGNISYGSSFDTAGIDMPPACSGGTCFASSFDCSLPQFQTSEIQSRQGFTSSVCILNGTRAVTGAKNTTVSDQPVTAESGPFLVFRSNGTYDIWRAPSGTILDGDYHLSSTGLSDGEWITFDRTIGDSPSRVLRLQMSMCFQQMAVRMVDVRLTSSRDIDSPSMRWDSAIGELDTAAVRQLLGVVKDQTDRLIFTVETLQDATDMNMTDFFNSKILSSIYNYPRSQNMSLIMDPYGTGRSSILPNVEYQTLFADILNTTNRPALAMQAAVTALSGSIINEALPQLDESASATITRSTRALVPRYIVGLTVVTGLVLANMICGLLVVLSARKHTRYSSRGDSWRSVAQLASEHTSWILEDATLASDADVRARLGGVDPEVKIALSERVGRVQVVMRGFK
jgi:hypothetical protein